MADNYPVPPPPPPPQNQKPVPPPPPRMGAPTAMPPVPPAPMTKPASASAPPSMPRPAGGMPPMPGMMGMPSSGPSALDQRLQEMEKRFQEQESAKISLEHQLNEIGSQLKEEHEKVILQSLKAKEEEALSSRVEQQIREMQDKLRRDKHEQELQESRGKAENQLKDLERRLAEERESWMAALKNQLKERELIEQDVEQNLSRKLREVEQRYQDEKIQWMTSLRTKDEELTQLRRQNQQETDQLKEVIEEKEELAEEIREASAEQRRSIEREAQAEMRTLQGQLDSQLRDNGTLKAQMALLQTQLHQAESLRQDERARAQSQFQRLEQDHLEMRKRVELQAAQREDDLKREYGRREQEHTQHWEGIAAQLRAEKEAMKNTLIGRDDEISRLQAELADQRRLQEQERSRWPVEIEKIRKTAREEVLSSLPEAYQEHLAGEQKKWEEHTQSIVQPLKAQLARAGEAQKALSAKLDVETQRAEQEIRNLREQMKALADERDASATSLQEERALRESQTREFMQRIAEMQLLEASLREETEKQSRQWQRLRQEWQAKLDAKEQECANLDAVCAEKNELQLYKTQSDKELSTLRAEIKAMAQTQLEWKNTMVQLQAERSQREQEWLDKEKTWQSTQAEWEKTIAELEKAKATAALQAAAVPAAAPGTVGPEAAKALAAIKQQMQEMQTLLTWLRPVKKQPFSKAA
jgi:myosin protein heavy chain